LHIRPGVFPLVEEEVAPSLVNTLTSNDLKSNSLDEHSARHGVVLVEGVSKLSHADSVVLAG